jgi:alpha-1,6-mannosyltransferase
VSAPVSAQGSPLSLIARCSLLVARCPLLVAGAALELTLILGWLQPLSLWRTPGNLPAGAPMVLILGQTMAGALRFAVPSAALALLWGLSLWAAERPSRHAGVVPLALGFTALFLVTLLPLNPGGTQDIYHNVADARLFWLYHANPTLIPPQAYADDPFFVHVWGYADLPSAYGPLWYLLSGLPVALAGDALIPNLVAQKALVASFMVGTTVLTAAAVRHVAPARAAAAVVLIGWCPLLLFESAGNGHNDSVMAFFLAAALLAAARRAYIWVLPLLTLSLLVKYTTALAGPVALIWLLQRPDVRPRQVVAGLALSAALTLLAFTPLVAGRDTVAALQRPGMTFILSPATLLHGLLAGALPDADAAALTRAVTGALFGVIYAVTLLRTRGDVRDLAARCFDALFAYLLLVSWWFWPWYLTWLAPAAALCRDRTRPLVFVAATAAALFTYLYWWQDPPWRSAAWFAAYAAITTGVFLLPAAVLLGVGGLGVGGRGSRPVGPPPPTPNP